MLPGADTDCCDGAGKCSTKPKQPPIEKDCETMPLEPQASRGDHSPLIPIAVAPVPVAAMAANLQAIVWEFHDAAPREHSPPDLQALFASFLI